MTTMTTKVYASLASFLVALALLLPVRSTPAAAQRPPALAVIIGSSSRITDITSGALRSAFLNLPVTYQGQRLLPFNLPSNSTLRTRFDRAVLGLDARSMGQFWVDQRVRDARRPPRDVPNPELAVRVVASLEGAISYVPLELTGTSRVRVLRVDGKAPTDANYLIE
jgi:hypothetical protein